MHLKGKTQGNASTRRTCKSLEQQGQQQRWKCCSGCLRKGLGWGLAWKGAQGAGELSRGCSVPDSGTSCHSSNCKLKTLPVTVCE